MSLESLLTHVLAALREVGGYFVWRAEDGQEYVIVSRREFESRSRSVRDTQLDLLDAPTAAAPWTADDMLEKINHDLALYQLQRENEAEQSLDEVPGKSLDGTQGKPFDVTQGKRVRFEPLRGDLPPSLQE